MIERRSLHRAILGATAAVLLGIATLGQSQTAPAPAPAPAPTPAPAAAPERPAWPDFAAVTKDMQATPGLFTLYRYRSDDPSKDQTRLLAQIPRALLNQDLLMATSISRGSLAGFQWEDYLIRFDIVGKNLVVKVPDPRYVNQPGTTSSDVIARTYPAAVLTAMPIITMAGADPVVDLGSMVMGPTVQLPGSGGLMSMLMGGGGGTPRRDLSEYSKVKAFPDNVLIDVNLAMASRGTGASYIGISYAFRRLPDVRGYAPRIADERVGYFTTVRQDWNMRHSERENIVRYVNRWDIRKKDPALEISPPDKPIVFVVEKTVPLQWRRYVKEGIEEWNKAYEKIGIVGAVVVQQQTDDNEFANVDPEDARYNFFRWIVSGRAFAMGPSRPDPRTGQILDADIIFDDAMLRFYLADIETMGPRPAAAILGPEHAKFLMENPSFIPMGQSLEQVREAAKLSSSELMYDSSASAATGSGPISLRMVQPQACNYAEGLRHQMALLNLAVAQGGKKVPERLIGEIIRQVTAHEVGHTLGLRHNFKASAWLTADEIKRRRDTTDEPTATSVMDYLPVLFMAGDQYDKTRHLTTPCIGPYDYWAVEYGYKQPTPADGDEKTMLGKIAAQNTKREYAYATDEDTMGLASPDPLVNRFDHSADPIAWAQSRIVLSDSLMKDIKKWSVKENDPNHFLRATYLTVISEKAQNLLYVSRMVGGQYHHRNRPGDPDARPALVLVDPKQQRAAIKMLGETAFRDDFYNLDPELLNDLAPPRWMDWASRTDSRLDFPVHQMVSSMQSYALAALISPQALQRVYDAELKSKAADKFTAAELLTSVRGIVWSELEPRGDVKPSDTRPLISSTRRNLQRQHLQVLIAIAESEPGQLVSADLQGMARFTVRELGDRIGGTLDAAKEGAKLDFATKAHLTECRSLIQRTLDGPKAQAQRGSGRVITVQE